MRNTIRWTRAAALWGLLALACGLPGSRPATAEEPAKSEDGKAPFTNRLAGESSPYLLLHQHNPVDWYPWGPEAFARAKEENKPIFLSIGYSSCYWCHVMERLVFQNEEIAKYMNEHFVNVKVDREERPDIDDIYMTSLIVYYQLIRSPQGGGWPLSMFLTPDGKPFAGGTYFPPEAQGGRLGFPDVLTKVNALWTSQEDQILQNAEVLTSVVQKQMKPRLALQEVALTADLPQQTAQALKESYDKQEGGIDFNPANPDGPKFPTPAKLRLLMDRAVRGGDEEARGIVLHTLEAIARGGIRDHLGGGFHRYSTDRQWHVPHFEKMLYDQAQLVPLYLQAWELDPRPLFRDAAVETLDYVLRELTDPAGGFYSAMDAETESVEGKYYVWEQDEIEAALGAEDAARFAVVYGLDQPNPFEHGFVLHLPRSLDDSAAKLEVSPEALRSEIAAWRTKLLAIRNARPRPLLDDKVLTSWNGLMIGAFADAGRVLGEPRYTETAVRAADFLLSNLRTADGDLLRTWRGGEAKLNGYLDDYAFLIDGLLALHDATDDARWLTQAEELQQAQLDRFWDEEGGGFFFTSHDHEALIARTKNAYDAVLPAGNSVSALNLVRLARKTGREDYRTRTGALLKLFAPVYADAPRGLSVLSIALSEYLTLPAEQPADDAKATSGILPADAGHAVAALRQAWDGLTRVNTVAAQKEEEPEHRVKITPYLNVDKLPPGKTCQIVVYVEIDKGWHINTNPAKPDFYIPTVLSIKSKSGVKLTKVTYPEGKPVKIEGLDKPQYVYDGKVAIRGELMIPESAAGKADEISIDVQYQACNDLTCLRKKTISKGGKVAVAGAGESVQTINKQHFPE